MLKRDGPVEVVNVCTGIPDRGFVTRYDRLIRATESAALFEARIEEDRAALALAGRAPRGLGFLEAQYRDESLDRGGVAAALERAVPACSGIVLPAGIGGHEDHVAVRDAGFELADGAAPITLYAELPYAIHKGWPHWVTGTDPDPHLDPESDWDFYLETVPCPRDALRPAPRTLSEAEADEKLAALRTYRTQFSSLNSGAIDRFGNPGVRSHEMFWSVDLSHA